MRQSKLLVPTIKEVPSNAEIKSHKLLLKAGYIKQTASGIYSYLPMATKVLANIEEIIRQELDAIGAGEVRLPFLEPSDLWELSGRWGSYGDELFRVVDRHNRSFALAPTHEEVAVDLVKNYLNSYKKFPLNIYQIQTKMRDERRPRFGLLRGREFVMMDGYAFAKTEDELKTIYDDYYEAYLNIFKRLGLDIKVVEADNGSMGGQYSHEFMALSDVGEDFLAVDQSREHAFNIEVAPVKNVYEFSEEPRLEVEEVHTPGLKKIDELTEFFNENSANFLKAVCYNIDGQLVISFVLGNRKLEETKVLNLVGGESIEIASDELLEKHGLTPGYVGPIGLREEIRVLFDREAEFQRNLIVGANKKDYHYKNFNFSGKESYEFVDVRSIEVGDYLSENGNPVQIVKGIEVGHIFALGRKYAEALKLEFLDEGQKKQTPTMGSFGIGVSRVLGAIVEQSPYENEVVLPKSVTPYDVHIIPLEYAKSSEQREYVDVLIRKLSDLGITYLIDDRDQRAGVKFKDAELIGIPYHIVVGKNFESDILEFKDRINGTKLELSSGEILKKLKN